MDFRGAVTPISALKEAYAKARAARNQFLSSSSSEDDEDERMPSPSSGPRSVQIRQQVFTSSLETLETCQDSRSMVSMTEPSRLSPRPPSSPRAQPPGMRITAFAPRSLLPMRHNFQRAGQEEARSSGQSTQAYAKQEGALSSAAKPASAVLPSVNHQAEDASAAQPQQSALQLAAAGAGPSLARPAQSETGRVSPRQAAAAQPTAAPSAPSPSPLARQSTQHTATKQAPLPPLTADSATAMQGQVINNLDSKGQLVDAQAGRAQPAAAARVSQSSRIAKPSLPSSHPQASSVALAQRTEPPSVLLDQPAPGAVGQASQAQHALTLAVLRGQPSTAMSPPTASALPVQAAASPTAGRSPTLSASPIASGQSSAAVPTAASASASQAVTAEGQVWKALPSAGPAKAASSQPTAGQAAPPPRAEKADQRAGKSPTLASSLSAHTDVEQMIKAAAAVSPQAYVGAEAKQKAAAAAAPEASQSSLSSPAALAKGASQSASTKHLPKHAAFPASALAEGLASVEEALASMAPLDLHAAAPAAAVLPVHTTQIRGQEQQQQHVAAVPAAVHRQPARPASATAAPAELAAAPLAADAKQGGKTISAAAVAHSDRAPSSTALPQQARDVASATASRLTVAGSSQAAAQQAAGDAQGTAAVLEQDRHHVPEAFKPALAASWEAGVQAGSDAAATAPEHSASPVTADALLSGSPSEEHVLPALGTEALPQHAERAVSAPGSAGPATESTEAVAENGSSQTSVPRLNLLKIVSREPSGSSIRGVDKGQAQGPARGAASMSTTTPPLRHRLNSSDQGTPEPGLGPLTDLLSPTALAGSLFRNSPATSPRGARRGPGGKPPLHPHSPLPANLQPLSPRPSSSVPNKLPDSQPAGTSTAEPRPPDVQAQLSPLAWSLSGPRKGHHRHLGGLGEDSAKDFHDALHVSLIASTSANGKPSAASLLASAQPSASAQLPYLASAGCEPATPVARERRPLMRKSLDKASWQLHQLKQSMRRPRKRLTFQYPAGYDPKAYWTFVPLPSAGSEQQAAASPDVSVADQSSPLVLHPSVPIVADVYTSTATPALSASLASADQQPVDSLAASAAAQPAIDATARANKSTSSGRFDNKQLRAVTAPKADATALDAVNSPWSIKTAAQPVPQDQEAALGDFQGAEVAQSRTAGQASPGAGAVQLAGSRRKSFGKLAALLIFAILAGLGAVCLTSHSRFGPALSHWRDSHSATHADPSAQHPIFLKLSIPTWLMHGPSVQHVQMLQHYTPWLTQPLVAADVAVESERDSQLAQDSWQQHVIPAIFKQHSTDSTILAQTDAASGIWQRLSARLPAPVLQICSQAISWLSRLRMQQPGSADFQSQLAELEEQPPDQSESDSADQVALRPELMWQHLRSVLQRVTDGLKGHLAARADSQLTPGAPKPDSASSGDDGIEASAAAESASKTTEVLLTGQGQDFGVQPDSSSLPRASGHSECEMSLPAEALSEPVSSVGNTDDVLANPQAGVPSQEQEPASQDSLPTTQSDPQAGGLESDAAAAPEEGAGAEPPADALSATDEPILDTAADSALTGAESGMPESACEQPNLAQAGPQEAEPAVASPDPPQPSQQEHADWHSQAAVPDDLPQVLEPAAEDWSFMPADTIVGCGPGGVGGHANPAGAEVDWQAEELPKSMLSRLWASVSALFHSQSHSRPDQSVDEGSEEHVAWELREIEVPAWCSHFHSSESVCDPDLQPGQDAVPSLPSTSTPQQLSTTRGALQPDSLPSTSTWDPSLSHDSQLLDSDSSALAESSQAGSQEPAKTQSEAPTQPSLISKLPLTALYAAMAAAAVALLGCLAARHMGSAAQHMHQAAAGHALADAMQRMSITSEIDAAALTGTPMRPQPAGAPDSGVESGALTGGRGSRRPRNRELASLGDVTSSVTPRSRTRKAPQRFTVDAYDGRTHDISKYHRTDTLNSNIDTLSLRSRTVLTPSPTEAAAASGSREMRSLRSRGS